MMDENFWNTCWETQEIGFHMPEVNPVLLEFWSQLAIPSGEKVLVPLCGKSLDLKWLMEQGQHVVGVELSKLAVEAFFSEQSISPQVESKNGLQLYTSDQLALWCGNIFSFPESELESIQAVYDRGALVALPFGMRKSYMEKLLNGLSGSESWLLVTFEYDESLMQGPPFSIPKSEVQQYFEGYEVCLVDKKEMIHSVPKAKKLGLSSIVQCVYVIAQKNK
ncbi:MAG: thiopurine S-methyltransferase [Pseudomonadales bacterium]|nr:thiopurine S-methyltransferase [Pseudomonadales bacterium]